MRHASIQTTMNVYGKAITNSKRHAQSNVMEIVLGGKKPTPTNPDDPAFAIGS
jgi:hypothetical protein